MRERFGPFLFVGICLLAGWAAFWIAIQNARAQPTPPVKPGGGFDIGVLRGGCRWEILPAGAAGWAGYAFADVGAELRGDFADQAKRGLKRPARWTLLLDQCSGRTWRLEQVAFGPASGGLEWVPVRRVPY